MATTKYSNEDNASLLNSAFCIGGIILSMKCIVKDDPDLIDYLNEVCDSMKEFSRKMADR